MLHHRCKAAALSVQGCCTIGARVLDHRYKGAGPSVSGCWTISTRVLDHRYQGAALFWYHSEYLYIDLIKKNRVNP